MVNGFRYYTALESVSMASALSTARTIYPCQIRVHRRWQSKLQLPTAQKKEWLPATADSSPHAVTCQHCAWASICSQSCKGPFPFPPLSLPSPPAHSLPFPFPSPLSCREAAPQTQLGGLGSAVSSPGGIRGRSPAANAFWVHLELKIASGGSSVTCHIVIH